MRIRHDMKRIPRATLPPRSARRIANAQRAVEADKEACGFFPELAKFQTAEERLDHIDAVEMRRWQLFRDYEASCWRKVRRLLQNMEAARRDEFLRVWNASRCPAEATYALDYMRRMFPEVFKEGAAI